MKSWNPHTLVKIGSRWNAKHDLIIVKQYEHEDASMSSEVCRWSNVGIHHSHYLEILQAQLVLDLFHIGYYNSEFRGIIFASPIIGYFDSRLAYKRNIHVI